MNKLDRLQQELFKTFKPKSDINLLQFAEKYGRLSPENSSITGRFKPYPYQRKIIKDMSDPKIKSLAWMKSTRVGYTRAVTMAIAYYIKIDPAPQLFFAPNDTKAREFAKKEMKPMIRDMKLDKYIYQTRMDDNLLSKAYKGGFIEIRGGNTANNFASATAKMIYLDELDRYADDLDLEGSVVKMANKRNESFSDGILFMGSTPTIKGASKIEREFFLGDMNRRFVKCQGCGALQIIHFKNIIIPQEIRQGVRHWNTKDTYMKCDNCDYKIPHSDLRKMDEQGIWRQTQKHYCCETWHDPIKTESWNDEGEATCPICHTTAEYNKTERIVRSYHIWSAYSQQPQATWENLANEYVEALDDKNNMKTFVNTWLGETFEDYKVSINTDDMMNDIETYENVPDDARFVIMTVDKQKDRLEYLITAWLDGEISYNLKAGIVEGDIEMDMAPWRELDRIFKTPLKKDNGNLARIYHGFVDMGGLTSDSVKHFIRTTDNWTMLKGSSNETDSNENMKPLAELKISKNGDKILWVGTTQAKDIIFERLSLSLDKDGSIHHNQSFEKEWFDQLASEKKIERQNKHNMKTFFYTKTRPRNEALDLVVYQLAGVRILQEHLGTSLIRE